MGDQARVPHGAGRCRQPLRFIRSGRKVRVALVWRRAWLPYRFWITTHRAVRRNRIGLVPRHENIATCCDAKSITPGLPRGMGCLSVVGLIAGFTRVARSPLIGDRTALHDNKSYLY